MNSFTAPLAATIGFDVALVEMGYMLAAAAFVVGIKLLGRVKTARKGNNLAAVGMALAILATFYGLSHGGQYTGRSLVLLVLAVGTGSAAGAVLAVRVPMTAMPEFVAFFNGLGGAASMFVALAEVPRAASADPEALSIHALGGADFAVAVFLSVWIGAVTASGSLVAYGKLAGKLQKNRIGALGTIPVNALLAFVVVALGYVSVFVAESPVALYAAGFALTLAALVLGVGLTLPIGGADMPVAIALLNSYSGMAGMTTGFILDNNLLIVAGSLVGASGIILTRVMCKAMNRSLGSVLIGAIGDTASAGKAEGYSKVKTTSAEEIAPLFEAARLVIIVPGYGLAVAQAQHKVRELAGLLEKRGCTVKYAIHPVAGRMPGHMNILLAEADVPYEQLFELDRINDEFRQADVALVLGANDVCNPAALRDPTSPIAGMPVLTVWEARTVVVVKRSLAAGYAGIRNDLFEMDNSLMFLADAKQALDSLVSELKSA